MATRSTSKKPPAKAPAKKAPARKMPTRCPDCGGPIKNGVCQNCGYAVK